MFGHLKIFSILGLLMVTAVGVAGGVAVRNNSTGELQNQVLRQAAAVAKGYERQIWKPYSPVVLTLALTDSSKLRDEPRVAQFAQETVRYFQGLGYVRVNIYSRNNLLLMTTNPSSAKKLKTSLASPDSAYVGRFLQAGVPGSQILDGAALENGQNARLVQAVAPLAGEAGPEGAVELIYDFSEEWARQQQFQAYVIAGAAGVFIFFLLVLFLTSKRAEAIIAKQHEANIELAAAAATAQAENREKSQFLANISHELRTPLNAIIGFSDIIKNEVIAGMAEKKYHDYINDIHSSGVHLLSLINDILDYSKAEAGKLELEVTETNATKLVQNCMRLVVPRAESAQVRLVENMPKEQIIMQIDSKKLKQILLNLLSNAVKFTPAGGEVRVSAWREIAEDAFSFEVRDTGIGIAPKDISRAMAPFGQVDSALSRKYEGTGLGLPLTKKFVELMGGKFAIESELGKGTTITFTLPREMKERDGVMVRQVS